MDMKTREVRLWFDPDRSAAPDGLYKMMGGMFFPSNVIDAEGNHKIVGYAVMAGIHKDTKTLYIFDETEWYTVDHILSSKDGGIDHEGLVTWINNIWTTYYCNTYAIDHEGLVTWINNIWTTYYCNTYACRQYDDLKFSNVLAFSKSRMVQPKPSFFDAAWDDPIQPMSIIYRWSQLGQIKYATSSKLFAQLEEYKAMKGEAEKMIFPAVHALRCMAVVLDRFYTR